MTGTRDDDLPDGDYGTYRIVNGKIEPAKKTSGPKPGSKNKKKTRRKTKKIEKPIKVDPKSIEQQYKEKKDKVAARDKLKSMLGRDIGSIPAIFDRLRHDECKFNFRLFCEKYGSQSFTKAWSRDHLKAIDKIEDSVLRGGLFGLAMPRGSGKTTLTEFAVIWAIVYGHRKFIALIGSDEAAATEMLESIKSEFEHNDLLLQDFPSICMPIIALDGTTQRSHGQLCEGKRTEIKWKGKEIVFPTIDGSPASGSCIKVAGITGRVRGMKRKLANGQQIRPDLVVIDDPQTDESAHSPKQNETRLDVVAGAILGLAGPGEKIAGFMPCTVIAEGDMADTILNPILYPEWQGQRTRMIVEFPTNEQIWVEYQKIYEKSLQVHGNISLATDFYIENRDELEEGAVVSWEERFNPDEASALQHAMNLKIRDEFAFWAEYQNEPKQKQSNDIKILTANQIVTKVNGYPRYEIPFECNLITCGVDVQKNILVYCVMAWADNGTCYVIDYGPYPKQAKQYFTRKDSANSYEGRAKGGYSADLSLALKDFVPSIMGREYVKNDGTIMRVDQMLIDVGWEKSKTPIFEFVRRSPFGNAIFPSYGRYYGPARAALSEINPKDGEKKGHNWVITYPKNAQTVRFAYFDANYWKTWIHERLSIDMGGDGCMSLYGKEPKIHRVLADHLTAEYVVQTEGGGRKVDEWSIKPSNPDNDLLDTIVLCAVGASMRGLTIEGIDKTKGPKKKKKVKRRMSDIIAEKRARRDR